MTEGVIDLTSAILGGITGAGTAVSGVPALTYPLSLPSVSGLRSIEFIREQVVGISESPFTFARQEYRHAGERWRVRIGLPPMSRDDAGQWRGFLLALDGGFGTFLLGNPFESSPRGVAWGSPKVLGAGQTGKTLDVTGFNTNIEDILKAGDYIEVEQRLYQVMRNANADGSGSSTLDIWPRLRTSPADMAIVVTESPRGIFQLANPTAPLFRTGINGTWEVFDFEVVEAL